MQKITTNQVRYPAPLTLKELSGKIHAPEFVPGLEWLNTTRPLTLQELHGKIGLLEFWTFC